MFAASTLICRTGPVHSGLLHKWRGICPVFGAITDHPRPAFPQYSTSPHYLSGPPGLSLIFSSCPLLSSGLADPELVSDQKLDKVSFVRGLRCVRSSLSVARSVYDSMLLRKTSHLGFAGAVMRDSKLSGLSYYFWKGCSWLMMVGKRPCLSMYKCHGTRVGSKDNF